MVVFGFMQRNVSSARFFAYSGIQKTCHWRVFRHIESIKKEISGKWFFLILDILFLHIVQIPSEV